MMMSSRVPYLLLLCSLLLLQAVNSQRAILSLGKRLHNRLARSTKRDRLKESSPMQGEEEDAAKQLYYYYCYVAATTLLLLVVGYSATLKRRSNVDAIHPEDGEW